MNTEVNNLNNVKTKSEEYYTDDNCMKQGEYKLYYSNGKLQQICNYVNGKFHGEYKYYHKNGQLRVICNYVNGEIQGEYKSYHSNGKLHVICNHVDDKIHGEYKFYHKNGQLRLHLFYIMDKQVDLSNHGMDINNLSKDDINLLMVIYGQQSE